MPRVIVHDLDQARAALAWARDADAAITLMSAPGAAATLGVGVWRAMADLLRDEFAGLDFEAALDCADDAGAALAAIAEGVAVRFVGPAAAAARLADIAARAGVRFVTGPIDAVDLSGCDGADAVTWALAKTG